MKEGANPDLSYFGSKSSSFISLKKKRNILTEIHDNLQGDGY